MDLSRLREQLVLQEERALDLGLANPSPGLIEELHYALQEVTQLRGNLPAVNGSFALRARADSVYAELQGISARWGTVPCACSAA